MPLAARLLRLFCCSARPQWDAFGHLSSYGDVAKPGKTASLSDRFGPDIWEILKGKRVLDYGCGYGADVLECAAMGSMQRA
jgi:2-polyprenyl-3-methyl-5-hydroxy-6-metoxy-1,4-benzoquinol methylase